jgi:hypothetical protein
VPVVLQLLLLPLGAIQGTPGEKENGHPLTTVLILIFDDAENVVTNVWSMIS